MIICACSAGTNPCQHGTVGEQTTLAFDRDFECTVDA